MKDKALIYFSLAVSVAALGYAAWIHQHCRQMAEQALREREKQFVQSFAPRMAAAYRDMGVTNMVAKPATLDELFGPLLESMNALDAAPPDKGDKKKP